MWRELFKKTQSSVQHTPAGERQTGLQASIYYAIGIPAALLWAAFISTYLIGGRIEAIQDPSPAALVRTAPPDFQALAVEMFPDPPRTANMEGREPFTDPSYTQAVQGWMREWERRSGLNFLRDHRSMKEAGEFTLGDVPEITVGNSAWPNIFDAQADARTIIMNEYTIEQFEIATPEEMAQCVRPSFFDQWDSCYDENGQNTMQGQCVMAPVFTAPAWCETGLHPSRSSSTETFERGLNPLETVAGWCPVRADRQNSPRVQTVNNGVEIRGFILGSTLYSPAYVEAVCGQAWREYATAVYNARTEADFIAANPFRAWTQAQNAGVEAAQGRHAQSVAQVATQRAQWVQAEQTRLAAEEAAQRAALASSDPFQTFQNANPAFRTAVRTFLLGGMYVSFLAYFLFGGRLAVFARPPFVPPHLYLAGFGFGAAYVASFFLKPDFPLASFFYGSLIFGVPALLVMLMPARLIAYEYAKETPLYRGLAILFRGMESARWGDVREYIRRDITAYFAQARTKIFKHSHGVFYLGKTIFQKDTRIGGRYVGLTSEHHQITIAGTRAGKSRDAIIPNLMTYAGGVVAFDPKGELTRVTMKRRAAYAPFYVLDPFNEMKGNPQSSLWNPLSEIDPESPSARADVERIVTASIYTEKGETGNAAFFRETGQKILRGYIAHVLTKYPEEERHLGTVYNLIRTGASEDNKHFNPKASFELLVKMAANPAMAGAARDAADSLNSVSPEMRGSHLSTVARGIDWINETPVRRIISGKSEFSLSECKTKDATVFLVMPNKYIEIMGRFLRTFYTLALDTMDEYTTPQPEGSNRRVLFLFDEFNTLGTFKPAETAAVYGAGSYIKCWFIMQNIGQLYDNYENPDNFTTSCDLQFFGIHAADHKSKEFLERSLGDYIERSLEGKDGETRYIENKRSLMSETEIAECLNAEYRKQIIIPAAGRPMILRRVPYFNLFPASEYGNYEKRS